MFQVYYWNSNPRGCFLWVQRWALRLNSFFISFGHFGQGIFSSGPCRLTIWMRQCVLVFEIWLHILHAKVYLESWTIYSSAVAGSTFVVSGLSSALMSPAAQYCSPETTKANKIKANICPNWGKNCDSQKKPRSFLPESFIYRSYDTWSVYTGFLKALEEQWPLDFNFSSTL